MIESIIQQGIIHLSCQKFLPEVLVYTEVDRGACKSLENKSFNKQPRYY